MITLLSFMMKWSRLVALTALCAHSLVTAISQTTPTQLEEVRANIDKWVETRQLLAKSRSDWAADKETLLQSVALIQKEIALIDEQITASQETATQADRARIQLVEENERLLQATTAILSVLGELERQTTNLASRLPLPLQERVLPLLKRIPLNPDQTRLSVSERMQSIVGILSELDKFNNSISVFPELRRNTANVEIQVKTIYVGLAAAYFADKQGQYGGIGTPTLDGWEWVPQPDIAPDIARAIAVYENTTPAQFIKLPVTVK